jgi:Kef-type K+ transport system membrane component KefB
VLLATSLAFCFALSYGAAAVGLAPIVGAFAAGLVLDAVAYRDLESREPHGLEDQLGPIAGFLVPVFFVVTGAKVQLAALNSASILLLAAALTLVAIIGKQACSAMAFGPGVNRLAVGLGMIPRGEVGLIFAAVGANLMLFDKPVVPPPTYAAVVVMVMVTTMVTPPVLAWALRKGEAADGG